MSLDKGASLGVRGGGREGCEREGEGGSEGEEIMASSLSCDVCFEQFTGGARWESNLQDDEEFKGEEEERGRRRCYLLSITTKLCLCGWRIPGGVAASKTIKILALPR